MVCGRRANQADSDDEEEQRGRVVKMLLLGIGESGKTTILKQMKILHINGFSEDERKQQISIIKQNINESIHDIVFNMDQIEPPVELENEENAENKKYILEIDQQPDYSDEYFDRVAKLWSDGGVKAAFRRSNEFQLIDCASHFLDRIADIRKPDYIPTTLDMLFCRKKTVNITEIRFTINVAKSRGGGVCHFMVYDVGGQRGERKKWIQVFEGITAVLFLIAASDFDQKLRKEEDETKNRLEEALELFDDICYSKYLRDSGMVVFLNKQDLLKKKIEGGQKLEKYFPEFASYSSKKAGNDEYNRARCFLEDRIMEIASKEMVVQDYNILKKRIESKTLPKRNTYIHHTIATDTQNIKLVLDSLHEMIIDTVLREGVFVF